MKILVVCQYYYPEPFRITDICETLVKNGHEITVLTGLPNYPEGIIFKDYRFGKKRRENLNGVDIIRCFQFGRGKSHLKLFINYFSYVLSASVKAFFMKEKYDVVFVNQLSPVMMAIPAIIYKRKNKIKMLLYCLDLWPESLIAGGIKRNSVIYKYFLKLSKWIYKNADSIFVTSNMFKNYFNDIIGISSENIEYLPQYSEELFLQKNETEIIDKNIYNFVFAGNIGVMQSVETIILAANELKNKYNIYFHIIGDGSALEKCKELVKVFKLNNVKFYGRRPVEKMPDFYNMADAMLITMKKNESISYTLPGKIQSYMAAGKPIIGAINGEANDVIKKADCGFCCEAEDYLNLSKVIIQFCSYKNKEQLRKNAYKYYEVNFNKNKFIKTLAYQFNSFNND